MALRRTGYRQPLYVGSACIAIGFVGLASAPRAVALRVARASRRAWSGSERICRRRRAATRACSSPLISPRALAALRSTGRQVGQIAAVSITTAIIAQSASPGQLEAKVFVAFAALPAACLPSSPASPNTAGRGNPAVAKKESQT